MRHIYGIAHSVLRNVRYRTKRFERRNYHITRRHSVWQTNLGSLRQNVGEIHTGGKEHKTHSKESL